MVLEWLVFADGFEGGNGVIESDCVEELDILRKVVSLLIFGQSIYVDKCLMRKVVSLLSPDIWARSRRG